MTKAIKATSLFCVILLFMFFAFAQTGLGLNQAEEEDIRISLVPGENFGPLEIWGDGKRRRWMANDAELIINNSQAHTQTINLKFIAESFFQERTLEILCDGLVIETLRIPSAPLFIAVKNLEIPPGEKTILLYSPQGPENIDARLDSGDKRNVSIAFGEFDWIDSSLPEAKKERTAAFSQRPAWFDWLTADENRAYNLQREGRFPEAIEIYQRALNAQSVDFSTYRWLGLCYLIVNDKDEAIKILQKASVVKGWSSKAISTRRAANGLIDYLNNSEIINHSQNDVALSFRSRGDIAQAVELYKKTLEKNPQDLDANYWLGIIYFVAERAERASEHLDTVIRLSPETHDARFLKEVKLYRELVVKPAAVVKDLFKAGKDIFNSWRKE